MCRKELRVLGPQSLERPAYKHGLWLASGNLDLGRVPTTDECLNCVDDIVYAEHPLSSESWNLGMWLAGVPT